MKVGTAFRVGLSWLNSLSCCN